MTSRVLSSSAAAETNQKLASGLESVQERIDRITGMPVTIPGWTTKSNVLQGFPAQYQSFEDPPITEKKRVYDSINQAYGTTLPGNPQVALTFGDADVQAWKEKEKMIQQLQFDGWLTQQYDPFQNPAEGNWLQSIYPEFFDARVEENKALHELQAQWNTIQIQGPKSKEDLYLKWRVSTDARLSRRLNGTTGVQTEDMKDYQRGFFNRSRQSRLPPFGGGATRFKEVGQIGEVDKDPGNPPYPGVPPRDPRWEWSQR